LRGEIGLAGSENQRFMTKERTVLRDFPIERPKLIFRITRTSAGKW